MINIKINDWQSLRIYWGSRSLTLFSSLKTYSPGLFISKKSDNSKQQFMPSFITEWHSYQSHQIH